MCILRYFLLSQKRSAPKEDRHVTQPKRASAQSNTRQLLNRRLRCRRKSSTACYSLLPARTTHRSQRGMRCKNAEQCSNAGCGYVPTKRSCGGGPLSFRARDQTQRSPACEGATVTKGNEQLRQGESALPRSNESISLLQLSDATEQNRTELFVLPRRSFQSQPPASYLKQLHQSLPHTV